mgnify:FL=1
MRKTKLGLILAMCVLLLTMLLTGCGGTGSVDTTKVEKAVLSVMNEALDTEFTNDESLRGKADYIWNKVDQNGKILWTDSVWFPTGENGELFWVSPIFDSDTFGEDSKFQLTAFTEEKLKKYENPSEELLARVKREIAPADSSTEITSICVTARNIGGKVYVVYVKESKSK